MPNARATAAAEVRHPFTIADRALYFPRGLFGFRGPQRFAVVDVPGAGDTFKLLQSLDDPDLAFTLADPWSFFRDYVPRAAAGDLEELGLQSEADGIWMAITTVPADFRRATVNLKAPLLVNPFRRLGKQVILTEDYSVRQPLFQT